MPAASRATYSVYLCDPFGVRLADASQFISLKYTRVVNGIGTAILILPGSFDRQMIRNPDGRIEIWRRLPGSSREYLDTETTWLIKKVRYERNDQGLSTIRIEADTPLCIVKEPGRISLNTYAATNLDDYCKTIVSDALNNQGVATAYVSGVGFTSARSTNGLIAGSYVSVAPNLSLAPSGQVQTDWRDILRILQDAANASAQAGTYLAFDIVAPTPDTYEFRTYIGQRGVDHRFPGGNNPIIIGPDFGNMAACYLELDYRNEATACLAVGPGSSLSNTCALYEDTTRSTITPFAYREYFVKVQDDTVALQVPEAQSAARSKRPRSVFQGKLINTPDTRYGVHWGWGDFVTVQAFGQSFDCRIDAISVTVDRDQEKIEAVLRNDQ